MGIASLNALISLIIFSAGISIAAGAAYIMYIKPPPVVPRVWVMLQGQWFIMISTWSCLYCELCVIQERKFFIQYIDMGIP